MWLLSCDIAAGIENASIFMTEENAETQIRKYLKNP
jgi:hypothetical protein